ncbi:MAG: hemin uptake protein HemP [Rhizobiaceae bacterium]|nr:hemin uptake protein HemP [Rhizobiaceae bacterium]
MSGPVHIVHPSQPLKNLSALNPLPVRTLSSRNLFEGRREIAIEHGESVYRLKITRQGKLILNK